MQISKKYPQGAAGVAQCRPSNPRSVLSVLGNEATQYRGRQSGEVRGADTLKIGGESTQVELILPDRGRAQPFLVSEIHQELRRSPLKRVVGPMRAPTAHVTRVRKTQHL